MTPQKTAVDVRQAGEVLAAKAGLDFSGGRGRWLAHFLARADNADPDWARVLLGEEPEAFAALCDAATVRESYFFREPGTLDFIRREVIPDLRRRPGRIGVWSAGCAGGEEAYTLGMMLFDAGLADRADVLGTDIAPSAVRAARTGSYTRWSMRGVDEQTLAMRFRQEGDSFGVVTERCADVTFERHNLFSPSPPSGGPFHLVLCRNVLIYLTSGAVQHVGALLVESLAPGGWLVTGVSDPSLWRVPGLEPVAGSGGTVYRRAAGDRSSTVDPAVTTVRPPDRGTSPGREVEAGPATQPPRLPGDWQARAERALLEARHGECERLARAALEVDARSAIGHSLLVRALASGGDHVEALSAATIAVGRVGHDSELRGLHAVLLLDAHRLEEAQVAARQALYLDPDNALAHVVLARASELLGDAGTAARASRNGQRILGRKAPGP